MVARFFTYTVVIWVLFIGGHLTLELPDSAAAQTGPPAAQRFVTIDFNNVDITIFIKYISELSGVNFVVDPSVQGQVTIISPTKISAEDAYRVFESVLEIHGFTTVPGDTVTKIVPLATARSQSVDILDVKQSAAPGDRIVTQLVPLQYTSPLEITQVLKPLISKTSVIVAHTQSGMLIITDTMSNIKRLLAIIETLDVPYGREQVAVIPLEHGNVEKVGAILQTIFQKSGAGDTNGAALPRGLKVLPYERINALVVLGGETEIDRVRGLVAKLDVEPEQGAGNIHVVYLQNAMAVELAKVLTALPRKEQGETEEVDTAAISEDVTIMADEETNALIVTASKAEFRVLKPVIEKLDIPRRMVYLEALIMEVNVDKNFEVGVQWFGGEEISGGEGVAFGAFSGEPAFETIEGLSDPETPILPAGLSLGVLKQGIEIGGITFPNIAAILRAYKSDEDINIIATPQILTTDNKRAEISVGENIPFITSQNTTASQQDYTQFDYKDVATKLKITPHIGQADTLRLEIETEVIKLKSPEEVLTPTTFKRTAQTTVVVEDSDTIVIGGIIGQDLIDEENKVPALGDIPLLGWLFKTKSTRELRTNMFIFITPRIVENPAEIARVTLDKEEQMGSALRQVKEELYPAANPLQAAKLADMGFALLSAGDARGARDYFSEALAVDPGNPYALVNLGVAFEKEGDYERAIQLYERLLARAAGRAPGSGGAGAAVPSHLVEIAKENLNHAKNLKQK
ncbi:MAG: type II secretion system secretin GspD [Desulfofustis sp.]